RAAGDEHLCGPARVARASGTYDAPDELERAWRPAVRQEMVRLAGPRSSSSAHEARGTRAVRKTVSALSRGALTGVRVVDLSRVRAGRLATQMRADRGRCVVKIEPPQGDETRQLGPPFDAAGQAAYFGALNRGKRGLSLDLSQSDGRTALEALLESADVLVENF